MMIASLLSMLGGGIWGYHKLLSSIKMGQGDLELRFSQMKSEERKQILQDLTEWYNIAQRSFQKVRYLQLQLQALELHVQRLEHLMRESGIVVPNRPSLAQQGPDGQPN